MSDPTKNLPWKVEHTGALDNDSWEVVSSTGYQVARFYVNDYPIGFAESLARMVASGSVAAKLYLPLTRMLTHHGPRNAEEAAIEREAKEAIAEAAMLLEPPREV